MAFATQTRKLYDGDVTLHFNPDARNRYQLSDGTAPVGVTTILSKVLAKEALMLWPMNMAIDWLKEHPGDFEGAALAHVRKSTRGKDVGSEVHEAIEQFLLGNEVAPLSLEGQRAYLSFVKWFGGVKPEVLGVERIVYSRKHNYAGTFDALLEIDGKVVLCDIKTSNASLSSPMGIYPEYFLQLGAYARAYHEENGWFKGEPSGIDDLMVINASKTGKLSVLRASDLADTLGLEPSQVIDHLESAWLSVVKLYNLLEPLKRSLKEMK